MLVYLLWLHFYIELKHILYFKIFYDFGSAYSAEMLYIINDVA